MADDYRTARLDEQVKLLVKTERRLYRTQLALETQVARIGALNEFTLAVLRARAETEIVRHAIDFAWSVFPTHAVIGIVRLDGAAAPLAFVRHADLTTAEPVALPDGLAELDRLELPSTTFVAPQRPTGSPLDPLLDWLARLAEDDERLVRDNRNYKRMDVVLSFRGANPGSPSVLLAFRSATVSYLETVVCESDRPFLDVIGRNLLFAMEMAALHNALERRVDERTRELSASLDQLRKTQRQLVEASRRAGMADVATTVLHNVGNALNSANISADVVVEAMRASRVDGVARAAELLRAHAGDPRFLADDEKGRRLPGYLEALAEALAEERAGVMKELSSLHANIDHIKTIVGMQQSYARPSAFSERLPLSEIVEEAIQFSLDFYERAHIRVERAFDALPPVSVDRHKLLQILLNLLSNARHALRAHGGADPRITIRLRRSDGERVAIEVEDNGCGIAPENASRIFSLGFTTKRDGHGLGLHGSACCAAEMGGSLSVRSDGLGRGAVFTVLLPG